jgi:putative ABC transport system permease protein
MPANVQIWSPLLAFGISVAVGLIFGLDPTRRAGYMGPIQGFRHE